MAGEPWYDSAGFYIVILTIINLMNFMDRGIIPGATEEFTNFIDKTINTSTPSLYIGLLQSSFIVGISLASPFFATLAHTRSPFLLVWYGMLFWTVAAGISGTAFYLESYEFLLVGRVLSGVGEAAFVCCTAPWIVLNAPPESKSSWLALFYTTTPVGTAFGYIYSSVISSTIGAKWAFYIEAVYMIPFLFFLFYMSKRFPFLPSGVRHYPIPGDEMKQPLLEETNGSSSTSQSPSAIPQTKPPTIWEETVIVCSYPAFVYITLGFSALTGTLIGLATFGSSFFLALGYFDNEVAASSVFGILVSVAGIVGFPIGGLLIDYISKHHHNPTTDLSLSPEVGMALSVDEIAANYQFDDETDPTPIDSKGNPVNAKSESDGYHSLKNLTDLYCSSQIMTISSIIGLLFLGLAYICHDVGSALTVIFFGTIFLFICNSSTSIGLVYSIPIQHRPFGLAFNLIGMHMLGDVPSPLVAGYLKDRLASGCVGSDDEVSTSKACRDDEEGIRLTMLIVTLWLVWCGVFYGIATMKAKGEMDEMKQHKYQRLIGDEEEIRKGHLNET